MKSAALRWRGASAGSAGRVVRQLGGIVMDADGGVRHGAGCSDRLSVREALCLLADFCLSNSTDAIEVGSEGRCRGTAHLEVFLSRGFGRVSGRCFRDDACVENSAEVGNAEQQHQEHRQDEGELHQRLATAGRTKPRTSKWSESEAVSPPRRSRHWDHSDRRRHRGGQPSSDPSTNPPVLFDE